MDRIKKMAPLVNWVEREHSGPRYMALGLDRVLNGAKSIGAMQNTNLPHS